MNTWIVLIIVLVAPALVALTAIACYALCSRSRWRLFAPAVLLLAGCTEVLSLGAQSIPQNSIGTPIVRGVDRGNAMLTVIACPMTPGGASILSEYLQTLQSMSPVVVATDRASARLILNMCASPPDADMVRAAAALRRTR